MAALAGEPSCYLLSAPVAGNVPSWDKDQVGANGLKVRKRYFGRFLAKYSLEHLTPCVPTRSVSK
jgi:hypothetical protein